MTATVMQRGGCDSKVDERGECDEARAMHMTSRCHRHCDMIEGEVVLRREARPRGLCKIGNGKSTMQRRRRRNSQDVTSTPSFNCDVTEDRAWKEVRVRQDWKGRGHDATTM